MEYMVRFVQNVRFEVQKYSPSFPRWHPW